MQVIEVNETTHIKAFLELPTLINQNNSEYIRHIDNDIEDVFNPSKNKYWKWGGAKRWLLKSDNNYIGKIAAFYHTEKTDKPFIGIGFFDCINNQEAANLLFDTAKNWLKKQGFNNCLAPVNFGERDSFWGLMEEGFKKPSYMENFNPEYYQRLFENYGFTKTIEQLTTIVTRSDFNLERMSKLAQRVFSNPNYEFRHMDRKNAEKTAEDFVHIYNKAWKVHEDYRPITVETIKPKIEQLIPIAPQELNWFAYVKGEPAGFFINVLDINQVLKKSKGKFDILTKLHFLLNKKKINCIRGIVFGVIPEYHNMGLEVGMIMKFYETVNQPKFKQFEYGELAWVGDFNPKMLSMIQSLGAKTGKVHYTYTLNF